MAITAPRRVLSIDVLRGITIAFMILVNDPGDWGHVYAQLDHCPWNGLTLTDLVFPTFLFLIGVSLIFSLEARRSRGNCRVTLTGHIFRRAAILFALDLFLSGFPEYHLGHMRIYGVLTRIALCYLFAGLILLATRRMEALAAVSAVLLVGYWALMRFVPVPGFGVPTHAMALLDPYRNLAAWIDRGFSEFTLRVLHTGVLYNQTRDPEGLLSTLPAIATTLIGAMAGLFLRSDRSAVAKRNGLALAGVAGIAAGALWNRSFPINKNLWTSSYVLAAAGCSLLGLALCYWLMDMERVQERSRWARALVWPWLVFGSNAIVVYVMSDLIVDLSYWIKVPDHGRAVTVWNWIYLHGFSHGRSTELTSVGFALFVVALCFVPNWMLWRRQIFVKI
ncbi:MAG TPA: heparan-alpha-glucosaminide N-acetyltransferase domain-containing protein [Granulicella sp.]|nr:heparan-alpha-glucosaminide N-acetyltransferase domain-containing protein [Granulicella sp.]